MLGKTYGSVKTNRHAFLTSGFD